MGTKGIEIVGMDVQQLLTFSISRSLMNGWLITSTGWAQRWLKDR